VKQTPLREPVFRALWIGVLAGNVGTWMQTVGAQWLVVHEQNAATWVSLVQTGLARSPGASPPRPSACGRPSGWRRF
jgi:hypothetical protein